MSIFRPQHRPLPDRQPSTEPDLPEKQRMHEIDDLTRSIAALWIKLPKDEQGRRQSVEQNPVLSTFYLEVSKHKRNAVTMVEDYIGWKLNAMSAKYQDPTEHAHQLNMFKQLLDQVEARLISETTEDKPWLN